jgi:tetratricopeptide (TPR) repeat protein
MAQQALALDNSLPGAHSFLSLVYGQKQQYDQAIAEGERAIALDPNNAWSFAMQAEALNLAGRPEEALRSVEQAMRLNPHYLAWYLIAAGWAYNSTGRYAEAITALKTSLLRNPNFLVAYLHLAISYLAQWASQLSSGTGTLEQALAAAQRVIALNDSFPAGHTVLGAVYLGQKQYELGIAEMERAIALDPNSANGYAVLAEVLGWMGRSEEALQTVEQALRRKPVTVDEHLASIGAAYYLAGKPEEAIAPLKQYLSRYPNILLAHLGLAAAYGKLGREAEARAEAAEVLRLNPNFSLEVARQRAVDKDPVRLEQSLAILRKAGLK